VWRNPAFEPTRLATSAGVRVLYAGEVSPRYASNRSHSLEEGSRAPAFRIASATTVGRKNPIRESIFRWMAGNLPLGLRWMRFRSIAAGELCSDSLMSNGNSLFRRISFLFRRKFSLFDRTGNSIIKGNQNGRLGRGIRADKAQNRENSLYFPWITGNRMRRMVRW